MLIMLGSYNKKQEFSGGYIKIKTINCDNFIKENIIDDQSKILLKIKLCLLELKKKY